MQALEELAVSYDVKDREIERSMSDKQELEEEVNKLQVGVAWNYTNEITIVISY